MINATQTQVTPRTITTLNHETNTRDSTTNLLFNCREREKKEKKYFFNFQLVICYDLRTKLTKMIKKKE